MGVAFQITRSELAADPDYDENQSRRKTGGYRWAGAWIDPSVPLGGVRDHPTMSLEESEAKFAKYSKSAKQYKVARALALGAQGDSF